MQNYPILRRLRDFVTDFTTLLPRTQELIGAKLSDPSPFDDFVTDFRLILLVRTLINTIAVSYSLTSKKK